MTPDANGSVVGASLKERPGPAREASTLIRGDDAPLSLQEIKRPRETTINMRAEAEKTFTKPGPRSRTWALVPWLISVFPLIILPFRAVMSKKIE
jgi:hypothetical protein